MGKGRAPGLGARPRSRQKKLPLTLYDEAKARGDTRGMHQAHAAAREALLKEMLTYVRRGRKKRIKERLGLT